MHRRYRRSLVVRQFDPTLFGQLLEANLIHIQDQFDARDIAIETQETSLANGMSSFLATIIYDGFLEPLDPTGDPESVEV